MEENIANNSVEENVKKANKKKEAKSWLIDIALAVVITLFLVTFVIINAKVPSESMENTIMTGDRMVAGKFAYWFSEPERTDIVIFRPPDDESVLYVKRIIGLPGDTVEIKNGGVYLNGSSEPLDEPYLDVETEGEFGPYIVPENSYFMMGDNRNNSSDSRYWNNPFVSEEKILGKVYFTYYPHIKHIK